MEKAENKKHHWGICQNCKGTGKKRKRIPKKTILKYQKAIDQFKKTNGAGVVPVHPKGPVYACMHCEGSGLMAAASHSLADNENYPHVAIIGGGISGVALAVACLHRRIPFTLYERDCSFDNRSQGYGLTLQQGSKAIAGLGILSLDAGVTSTRHLVHTTEGKVIGEWGIRKWGRPDTKAAPKRKNVHIARQSLRLTLLEQLGDHGAVQWGHHLLSFKESKNEGVDLRFQVKEEVKSAKADLVVGADGIRSTVRKLFIGEETTPLRYLGCIVILGICPLKNLKGIESSLLDSATVFQT